jgi:hypothetical protein
MAMKMPAFALLSGCSFILLVAQQLPVARAVDNGVGLTPPMGWRHWKAFAAHIDQSIMENMMDELVTKRPVDGVPTSLAELGYIYAGLDDHWQNCTRTCANGTQVPSWWMNNDFDYFGCGPHGHFNNSGSTVPPWHASVTTADRPYGWPQVDEHRFPDLKGMVAKAHTQGLRAGWYFGNYQCRDAMGNGPWDVNGKPNCTGSKATHDQKCERWDMARVTEGAVAAIKYYGFDSVKLDSGFPVGSNLSKWHELLNATGRPVMVENCHQGAEAPGMEDTEGNFNNCSGLTDVSDCPFNFWRTTGDPEPGWGTIMRELNSMRAVQNTQYSLAKRAGAPAFNAIDAPPRSRPGGFAYPGTMVVGDGSMTLHENQVHFGGWCIVSSPMILAFNLSDTARRELVWDTITNKEAIQVRTRPCCRRCYCWATKSCHAAVQVNQAWAGHPGAQVIHSAGNNSQVEVWWKPLGAQRTAIFVLNTQNKDAAAVQPQSQRPAAASLEMVGCNSSRASQRWSLSSGTDPAGDGSVTHVNQSVMGQACCWSIHGCSIKPGAPVGCAGGCKPDPDPATCKSKPCGCNSAFQLQKDGSIKVPMDGVGSCLTVSAGDKLTVTSCAAAATASLGNKATPQTFQVERVGAYPPGNPLYTISQGSKCVDSNGGIGPGPAPPPPGPAGTGASIKIPLSALRLGLPAGAEVKVRDVWAKADLPNAKSDGALSADVPFHGSRFFVLMPAGDAKWPLPFELAAWMRQKPPPTPP